MIDFISVMVGVVVGVMGLVQLRSRLIRHWSNPAMKDGLILGTRTADLS